MKKLAVLFDLDGTLVDTEVVHAQAESELLKRYGVSITPNQISSRYAGISTESYIGELVGYKVSIDDLISEKNQLMTTIVQREGINPIAGMPELVIYLHSNAVPFFIVSSSEILWIQTCLEASFQCNGQEFKYETYFKENYISCSEVPNPKPAPDIFLAAQQRMIAASQELDELKTNWLVIGDSLADLKGAVNANMDAVIWGNINDQLTQSNRVLIFSTPLELAAHVRSLVPKR